MISLNSFSNTNHSEFEDYYSDNLECNLFDVGGHAIHIRLVDYADELLD